MKYIFDHRPLSQDLLVSNKYQKCITNLLTINCKSGVVLVQLGFFRGGGGEGGVGGKHSKRGSEATAQGEDILPSRVWRFVIVQ